MSELFHYGIYTFWYNNLEEFYAWCNQEMKRLRPKGACAQDMATTKGCTTFCKTYPTFDDAYRAYMKSIEENRHQELLTDIQGRELL
ncbi:hypothetical protein NSQ93_22125 [Bacillus sp. FSL W8-0445]|uniref:hypothetical protein n=1 Tax=Bacillus sp. FSL W8-0445 TaxID=2954621 RepID=UPI0030FD817B